MPAIQNTSTEPIAIKPTRFEVKAGKLSPQNLEIAIRALHEDGLIVVENIFDHMRLNKLNEKMVEDAYELQARKENSPYNYNRGNIQQDPPPVKGCFDESIFLNPIVSEITSAHLGPAPKWTFCSANTALPPTVDSPPQSQPIHTDADFDHHTHPFALVINVPLVSMAPENGATEIWLGTHKNTTVDDQVSRHGDRGSGTIKRDLLEERRKVRAPSQPSVRKGSVIIRDLRLWHGGKPNLGNEPRVMLAMIHFAPWYRNPIRLEFADDLRETFESQTQLEIPTDWVTEAEALKKYLERGYGNSYDFDQDP
ncbi:Phytanoyl-CoA dioxygenase [Lasallia pustulata]|uniref:Phytanoyl-CoA dioxygenase n=1 Tax=Lasallia pustulata TaxID=136370 RepID=A0A1W5DCG3_9LECA|nr:Phytanoyl-CoA dioxygenase [Lasallia pustulata]